MNVSPVAGKPEGAAGMAALSAEWALWGKQPGDVGYRVLACSAGGGFAPQDFAGIIARYALGTPDSTPQYVVGWVPGLSGGPGSVALAIHGPASGDLRQSADRSRDALGRQTDYVRLFCTRYADLAEHGTSYTELLNGLGGQQMLPDSVAVGVVDPTALPALRVSVNPAAPVPAGPQTPPLIALGRTRELGERVAALLLTGRPVCVFGADEVSAADRLAFIDLVMSLLPYGLRSALSAATWASATAQDLKLRLFFANAGRDDGGRTINVGWDERGQAHLLPDHEMGRRYLDWLQYVGPGAAEALVGETDPIRFTEADIRRMITSMVKDRTVADTLEDLADGLDRRDLIAVRKGVDRLKLWLAGQREPPEQETYRRVIAQRHMLRDRAELQHEVTMSVYRVLFPLVFDQQLSYASYCLIEDLAGGPPRGALRSVLLEFRFDLLSWVLAFKAEPGRSDEDLMAELAKQGVAAATPLADLRRDIESIRPGHRATLYDFGVRYLCKYADDPRMELTRRGHLADTLEVVFPSDKDAQRMRIAGTLRYVYAGPLSRGDIDDLFNTTGLRPTAALQAAVRQLASPKAAEIVDTRAAAARLRQAGYAEESHALLGGGRRHSRPNGLSPNALVSKRTALTAAAVLVAAIAAVVLAIVMLA